MALNNVMQQAEQAAGQPRVRLSVVSEAWDGTPRTEVLWPLVLDLPRHLRRAARLTEVVVLVDEREVTVR